MSLRSVLIVLVAVGVLATLGLYWNQHAIERVMRDSLTVSARERNAPPINLGFKNEVYQFSGGTRVFKLSK